MIDTQYEDLLAKIFFTGDHKEDRTGTGTTSIFGAQLRYDLSAGFPLITTKKVFTKGIIHELLWLISGNTNIKYLTDHNVHIWDAWADENGDLGPVYGHQWRHWDVSADEGGGFIDQLAAAIETIKTNPDSRRIIVSAWNPAQIEDMGLPPCHAFFQFYVNDEKLSCQLYQRSADMFLGVPFNIASYSMLIHMVAEVCGLGVGDFVWTGGDCHIYDNHRDQVAEQLSRQPYAFPKLGLKHRDDIDSFKYSDFTIVEYRSHPAIKAPVAV